MGEGGVHSIRCAALMRCLWLRLNPVSDLWGRSRGQDEAGVAVRMGVFAWNGVYLGPLHFLWLLLGGLAGNWRRGYV